MTAGCSKMTREPEKPPVSRNAIFLCTGAYPIDMMIAICYIANMI
jgi:hypothetical protein